MRLAAHGLFALWLVVVLVQAPFLHTHPAEPAHGHGGFLHAHLDTTPSTGVVVEAPDEQKPAVWLDWLVSAKSRQQVPALVLPLRLVVAPSEERAGLPPVFVSRSHDPPEASGNSSRAPPH